MERKPKNCKGKKDAIGFGCGTSSIITNPYGLCNKCLGSWLFDTPEGREAYNSSKPKRIEIARKILRAETIELKRQLNPQATMATADTYFSRYVRLLYSENGHCFCYTCGVCLPIKEIQNGHYIKREHKSVRYNLNNCRPQCPTCNGDIKHNGKQAEFRVALVSEIGEKAVVELETIGRQPIKADSLFYRSISEKYRKLIKTEQSKQNLKIW